MKRSRQFLALLMAVLVGSSSPLLCATAALADGGSGHGGGGDGGGHGGGSGNSGHGGDGRGGDDHGGDDGDGEGRGGDDHGGKGSGQNRSFEGGWQARIRQGRFELFDPAGRLVISRQATSTDLGRF